MATDDVIPPDPNPRKRKTIRDTGEILRSRELYRYYQPPRTSTKSTSVITSDDPSLTAYAQLTAVRLQKRRAMISLIDHSTQWVIGESTKTVAPYDNLICEPGDELWIGGANVTLDSVNGLCISTIEMQPAKLSRTSSAKSQDITMHGMPILEEGIVRSDIGVAPINEIEDLSQHPIFMKYPFVVGPPYLRHYCGCPLRTRKGYYIGSLCIVDETPGKLSEPDREFLRWMANTVMEHLELTAERRVLEKVQRMQNSLSVFVDTSSFERKVLSRKVSQLRKQRSKRMAESPTNGLSKPSLRVDSINTSDGGSKPSAPHSKDVPKHRKLIGRERPSLIDRNSSLSSNASSLLSKGSMYSQTSLESNTTSTPTIRANPPDIQQTPESAFKSIFSRSCKLIREALQIDGVVIVDAGDGYLDNSEESQSLRSLSKVAQENMMDGIVREGGEASYFRQMGILGLDVRSFSNLNGEPTNTSEIQTGPMGNHFLEELFLNFPSGKIFSYDVDGTISSGEEDDEPPGMSPHGSDIGTLTEEEIKNLRKRPEYVRKNLSEFLPNSTSCIFVPLYEYANIPYASCFIWTGENKRVFVKEEMEYLRTFARLIMSEVVRLDTVSADRAKGAFISNISHELRSPLHGILASAELLDDTKLDTFQSSLLTAVESCGRTLLDTLNHVLDFSKLNRLQSERRSSQASPLSPTDKEDSQMVTDVDLAAITEEVVEGVFAGYDFRGINSHIVLENPSTTDIIPLQPEASKTPDEVTRRSSTNKTPHKREVEVIIDIEPLDDWHFRTQVGGFRRVIMNLVGNALKYTDKGYVRVKLDAEDYIEEESDTLDPLSAKTKVILTVSDSGRGISREFLKTKLFVPFSQENAMSSGSGLGMSIVRQILDILGGTIDVKSELGVGTEVTVTLLLNRSMKLPEISLSIPEGVKDNGLPVFDKAKTAASKKNIAFIGFSDATPSLRLMKNSLVRYAQEWYGMNVIQENSSASLMDFMGKADILLANETSPLLAQLGVKGQKPPMIILCSNAARVDMVNLTLAEKGGILDFASKPCGPKKLAKALLFCLTRTHTSRRSSQSSHASGRAVGNRTWSPATRPAIDREKSFASSFLTDSDGPPGAVRISPPVRSGSSSSEPVVYVAGVGTIASASGSSAVPMSSSPSGRKSIPFLEDFQAMRLKAQAQTQASMQSISGVMHRDSKSASSVPLPQYFMQGMHNIVDGALIGEGVEIDRPPFASPVIEKDNPLRPKSWAQWQSLNASADGDEPSPRSSPSGKTRPEDVIEELRVASGTPSILLVDDNPITMMLMTTYISKKGFLFSQAQNGLLALEAFRRRVGGYDIVLMDLQLPVMSGLDAVRAIRDTERSENRQHRAFIIALTGASNEAEALAAGCDKFFTKPIKLADLSLAIADYQNSQLTPLSQN